MVIPKNFRTGRVRPQNGKIRTPSWQQAFASRSAGTFAEALADDVVLESSVLTCPVEGRDRVMRVMGAASNVYETLVFTHEASYGPRSYLEWRATAFGGVVLNGVTVLNTGAGGRIVFAAIHHRPLDAVLRFSTELGARLEGVLDAEYFYSGSKSVVVAAA